MNFGKPAGSQGSLVGLPVSPPAPVPSQSAAAPAPPGDVIQVAGVPIVQRVQGVPITAPDGDYDQCLPLYDHETGQFQLVPVVQTVGYWSHTNWASGTGTSYGKMPMVIPTGASAGVGYPAPYDGRVLAVSAAADNDLGTNADRWDVQAYVDGVATGIIATAFGTGTAGQTATGTAADAGNPSGYAFTRGQVIQPYDKRTGSGAATAVVVWVTLQLYVPSPL